MENKLIVDITGLNRYHENLKNNVLTTKQDVISDLEDIRSGAAAGAAASTDATNKANAAQAAAEATAAADATSKANAAESAAKTYADGLVKDAEGKVKFDAVGSAAAAQAAAEATAAADATSKANAAQAAAEQKATDLNTAMDERVAKLEAIDHEKLALDASATAVAAIVAGAESDFDTLKEVADWINNDTTGAAALQVTVSEHSDAIESLSDNKQDNIADLETIRTGAAAGAIAEQNAKDYADDLVKNEDGSVKFDDKGAAAQALADAKADAANLYQEKGDYLIPSDLEFATDGDIDGLFA